MSTDDETMEGLEASCVDLTPYRTDSTSFVSSTIQERAVVQDKLWRQLESTGFCLVRGTGVDGTLCHEALRCCHAFLQETPESVRRSTLTKDRARRGYSPVNTENFASLLGEQRPNDLVRKFRIGNGDGQSALLQPNVWPDTDLWPESTVFQTTIQRYYDALVEASFLVLEALCDAVEQHRPNSAASNSLNVLRKDGKGCTVNGTDSTDTVTTKDSTTTSILTLLGYRKGARHQQKKDTAELVAAHTDVGVVTILLFDQGDCAVLQRHDRVSDTYIDVRVPPIQETTTNKEGTPLNDPVFVVNIGDCTEALSGLPSTKHRVVPRPGKTPRNCLALFVGLDPNVRLELPLDPDGTQTETMTYEGWRRRRIAKAQSVLRGNHGP